MPRALSICILCYMVPGLWTPTARADEAVSVPSDRAPVRERGHRQPAVMLTQPDVDLDSWAPDNVLRWDEFDSSALAAEDAATPSVPGVPYRIGVARSSPVGAVSVDTAGRWAVLPDGRMVWTLRIDAPGAVGMRIHFARFELPDGARVVITGKSDERVTAYQDTGPIRTGEFWAGTVFGETAYVEYQPGPVAGAVPALEIDQILHVYRRPEFRPPQQTPTGGEEGGLLPCEQDVTCFTVDENAEDSVGRMFYIDGGFGYVCSGALLADVDPNTFAGYFLTANHCISNQTVANTLEIWWFYETTVCNGAAVVGATTFGATYLAGGTLSDFSFFRLPNDPEDGQGFAAWSTAAFNNPVRGIHHPGGSFKRFSEGNLTSQQPICGGWSLTNYWYLDYFTGTLEGGSSGSPLFNPAWQVVGTATGICGPGPSCTGQSSYNNVYGKFLRHYPSIDDWLNAIIPDDSYENNDSIDQAKPILAGAHNLRLVDFDDYFALTVCNNATLTATATFSTSNMDLDMELMSVGGCVMTSSNGNTGTETVVRNFPTGATVVLRLIKDSGWGGDYTLTINLTNGNGSGLGCDPGIRYVKLSAPGCGDGMSWAGAYKQLSVALNAARLANGAVTQIWVAADTYMPTTSTDRSATFQLINGVAVYGGFAGTESDLSQRDLVANPTVLNGNIGNSGSNTDNSYHVVTGSGTNSTAILDGFRIREGNANGAAFPDNSGAGVFINGGSPTIANCYILKNNGVNGAGAYVQSGTPLFDRCQFVGNVATGNGGALNLSSANAVIRQATFTGNTAAGTGGAVHESSSSPSYTNASFANNSGTGGGGAIYHNAGAVTIGNGILWGNSPSQITLAGGGTATVSYSDVQGGFAGTGNLNVNPQFVDADGPDNVPGSFDDNLRLASTSPVIDAGNNAALPGGTTLDLDWNPRFADACAIPDTGAGTPPIVDMGGFEAQDPTPPCTIMGDLNGDLNVDADDVPPFVNCIIEGGCQPGINCGCGDFDGGGLGPTDVPLFVSALLGV